MGSYLNQYFKNKFYAIGFDTFKGTVNVLNGGEFETHSFQARENTFSNLLAQAKYNTFFLRLHKESPFRWTNLSIMNVYSNWQEPKPLLVKAGVDFDAIVFIRNTSASTKLSQK